MPANIMGIKACAELMPVFPKSRSLTRLSTRRAEKAYLYTLPYDLYEKHRIRRYGFHGTSHRYVSSQAAKVWTTFDKFEDDHRPSR